LKNIKISKYLPKRFKVFKIVKRFKNFKRLKRFRKFKEFKRFKRFKTSRNERGQLSLEFLLVSLVSILLLISFSLPLTGIAVDSTIDSADSMEIKSEIVKITNFIDEVYSDGRGSKRIFDVKFPRNTNIIFYNDSFSENGVAIGNFDLYNDTKQIKIKFNAPNLNDVLNMKKKVITRIIVEWPMNTENIVIKSSNI
jgi:hypothetical protein